DADFAGFHLVRSAPDGCSLLLYGSGYYIEPDKPHADSTRRSARRCHVQPYDSACHLLKKSGTFCRHSQKDGERSASGHSCFRTNLLDCGKLADSLCFHYSSVCSSFICDWSSIPGFDWQKQGSFPFKYPAAFYFVYEPASFILGNGCCGSRKEYYDLFLPR